MDFVRSLIRRSRCERDCDDRRPSKRCRRSASNGTSTAKIILAVASATTLGKVALPDLAVALTVIGGVPSPRLGFRSFAKPSARILHAKQTGGFLFRTSLRSKRGADEFEQVGGDQYESAVLQGAWDNIQKQRARRSLEMHLAKHENRVKQGEEADAKAIDHALRVAEAAAVDCPGVSIYVGRARATDNSTRPLMTRQIGYADLELKRPMQPDTIFRIFSMTKPIVAASMLPLMQKGLLSLGAPISQWLPEFDVKNLRVWKPGGGRVKARRPIRVIDLLRHTSGMFYPGNPDNGTPGIMEPELCQAFMDAGVRQAETPEEFSKRLAQVPLCESPGYKFTYSVGTALLARIAEIITGKPYDEYLGEALLDPLGMKDTGFFIRRPEQRERLANLYVRKPGKTRYGPPAFDEAPRKIFTYEPGSPLNADGGLFSTIGDYAKFVRFLLSDGMGIVKPELIRAFEKDHLAIVGVAIPENFLGFPAGFGFGTYVHEKRLCGWSGLGGTHFCFDVRSGRYSILMTQVLPFSWRYQQLLTMPARKRIVTQEKRSRRSQK